MSRPGLPGGGGNIGREAESDDALRAELERRFDVRTLRPGEEVEGYLVTVKPTTLAAADDEDRRSRVSAAGVHLYFVDPGGRKFRVSRAVKPYFYVELATELGVVAFDNVFLDQMRLQIVASLTETASALCGRPVQLEEVTKLRLAGAGGRHSALSRSEVLIRLEFHTVEDMRAMRSELRRVISKARAQAAQTAEGIAQAGGRLALRAEALAADARQVVRAEPAMLVAELFEADVALVPRFLIDSGTRCGLWYKVARAACRVEGRDPVAFEKISATPRVPPISVLAWDIEVTKDTLKFPDARKDQITLISFMCDGQGTLVVNREFVAADVEDFEYTPAPEFPGFFRVYNLPSEEAVIHFFLEAVRKLAPYVLVTYNGDNFDFEFLRIRAKKYKLFLDAEIGFPHSSDDGLPLPGALAGLPTRVRSAMGERQEFQGRFATHMDCLRWVERDSYLPCGSRGLKAVTKAKLRYDPREVDPEDMMRLHTDDPVSMAEYSVSDAVATYYLYRNYIHNFVFALSTVVPLPPDDVLRKGSGTLCEHLLMAEAFSCNILIPNRHMEPLEKWNANRFILTETYAGGRVAQLTSGIYRSDLPQLFQLNAGVVQSCIDSLDATAVHWLQNEAGAADALIEGHGEPLSLISNWSEVKDQIAGQLRAYVDQPVFTECPSIYHYDVAAMYPNIILSNRLQPTSMIGEDPQDTCASCPYNASRSECQKAMSWKWRGEVMPLTRTRIELARDHLSQSLFDAAEPGRGGRRGLPAGDDTKAESSGSDDDSGEESEAEAAPGAAAGPTRPAQKRAWTQLGPKEKNAALVEYLKMIARKQSGKFKQVVEEERVATICMRQHSFYVDTVRAFRDRRYIFKVRKKEAEEALRAAKTAAKRQQCEGEIVLYDSLQLAHKCILNSFYGYVMRKGARWYSMEMAAVVTYTGAEIIREAHLLCEAIGKPLELDTDGIWTLLPASFPQTFTLSLGAGEGSRQCKFNYPVALLNARLAAKWTNDKYLTWDAARNAFSRSSENSVFFEVDGPYRAMLLPSATKRGATLKKRYAVFDGRGELAELKGFELKRRGELEVIKIFQEEVFPAFLAGRSKEEAYAAVGGVATKWLSFLRQRAAMCDDAAEVFSLLSESKFMSHSAQSQAGYKSMAMTTAQRLTELLGDETYLTDAGVKCQFVVLQQPSMDKTARAVPVQLFDGSPELQRLYLAKWLDPTQGSKTLEMAAAGGAGRAGAGEAGVGGSSAAGGSTAAGSSAAGASAAGASAAGASAAGAAFGRSAAPDVRHLLDWDYYFERLSQAVLKIVVIPAVLQGCANPVPLLKVPDWVLGQQGACAGKQIRLDAFFVPRIKDAPWKKEEGGGANRAAAGVADPAPPLPLSAGAANTVKTGAQISPQGTEDGASAAAEDAGQWWRARQERWRIHRERFTRESLSLREIERNLAAAPRDDFVTGEPGTGAAAPAAVPLAAIFAAAKTGVLEATVLDAAADPLYPGVARIRALFRVPAAAGAAGVGAPAAAWAAHALPVAHRRRIVVNARTPALSFAAAGVRVEPLAAESGAQWELPRRIPPEHLFALTLSQPLFEDAGRTLRPGGGGVVSVHGTKRSFDFDLLVKYGDVVEVRIDSPAFSLSRHPALGEVLAGPGSLHALRGENAAAARAPLDNWLYVDVIHFPQSGNGDVESVVAVVTAPPGGGGAGSGGGRGAAGGSVRVLAGGRAFTPAFVAQCAVPDFVRATLARLAGDGRLPAAAEATQFKVFNVERFPSPGFVFAELERVAGGPGAAARPRLLSCCSTLPAPALGKWAAAAAAGSGYGGGAAAAAAAAATFFWEAAGDAAGRLRHAMLRHSGNFLRAAVQTALESFASTAFKIEWAVLVARAYQLPLFTLLRESAKIAKLNHFLLDVVVARALEERRIVPWDSTDTVPDIGNAELAMLTARDSIFPTQDESVVLARPKITFKCVMRLRTDNHLFALVLHNLERLFEIYQGGPKRQGLRAQVADAGYLSHTTMSDRALRALAAAAKTVHAAAAGPAVAGAAARRSAAALFEGVARSWRSWALSPGSLLYEPVTCATVQLWVNRYLMQFGAAVRQLSDGHIEPVYLSENTITLETPAVGEAVARGALALLQRQMASSPLFAEFDISDILGVYASFAQFSSHDWLGWRVEGVSRKLQQPRRRWEYRLPSVDFLPAPLQDLCVRQLKLLLSKPLAAAEVPESTTQGALREAILRSARAVSRDVLRGFTNQLDDLEKIKRKWILSGGAETWVAGVQAFARAQLSLLSAAGVPAADSRSRRDAKSDRRPQLHGTFERIACTDHHAYIEEHCWAAPWKPGRALEDAPAGAEAKAGAAPARDHVRKVIKQLRRLVGTHLGPPIKCSGPPASGTPLDDEMEGSSEDEDDAQRDMDDGVVPGAAGDDTCYFKSLWQSVILEGVPCARCFQAPNLDVVGDLVRFAGGGADDDDDEGAALPAWPCGHCGEPFGYDQLDARLTELLWSSAELVQNPALTCSSCLAVVANPAAPYCPACGGAYQILRSQGKDQAAFFRTLWSLRSIYAPLFPTFAEAASQMAAYGLAVSTTVAPI